jgi:hypothetical protein
MLRLIPHWYEIEMLQQSANTKSHYFDPKTVGEGHAPQMDWGIVAKADNTQTSTC